MVRQLTAIMFTDMVGYTALMQENEHQAKLNRDRHRAVLKDSIAEHGGRILQFYGDGTLSVFQSAVRAVQCAVDIQHRLLAAPPIPVRIGLHTGDVVHDEDGVFGDGVNVAARIQGLSVPGGVLISEKVFDEVKNQPEIDTRPLGAFNLKNVKRPMEVYAIVGDGLAQPEDETLAPRRAGKTKSIAVLPFVNMSSDPENEFFSDGITEEIINALTRVNGLQVTARTSSFTFKNRNEDIRTIAKDLGVTHVLEGSVRKAGNTVRVTAQLICARNGYHLFSEVYEGSLDNIFETQDEISRTIVEQLADHLTPVRTSAGRKDVPLVQAHFHDTEAYTEYLKGRFHWRKWTPEGARLAIQHFRRSADMDPSCALPFTGLASAYVFLGAIGHMPASEAYPKAEEAALHAVGLEEAMGESHVALATVKLFYHWDWEGAYHSYQKALSITPGSADVRQLYSIYLKSIGDFEEAVEQMRIAVALDPLSLPLLHSLGQVLFAAGRLDEAQALMERSIAMDPSFRAASDTLGWIMIAKGDLERARELFEGQPEKAGHPYAAACGRGHVYARLGQSEDAYRILQLLEERGRLEPQLNLSMDVALVYLGLGDHDRAFEYLNQAVDDRLGAAIFLQANPLWQPLRSDPRYYELLSRIGVPHAVPRPRDGDGARPDSGRRASRRAWGAHPEAEAFQIMKAPPGPGVDGNNLHGGR